LPDGEVLSFTRLQDMIELTPGNLITHVRWVSATEVREARPFRVFSLMTLAFRAVNRPEWGVAAGESRLST
jgi:hypothetical protein